MTTTPKECICGSRFTRLHGSDCPIYVEPPPFVPSPDFTPPTTPPPAPEGGKEPMMQSKSQYKRLVAQGAPDPERRREKPTEAGTIQRYDCDGATLEEHGMAIPADDGRWVRWDDIAPVIRERDKAVQMVEAFLAVRSGQACEDEQRAGNGPCGACVYCQRQRAEAAESDAARLREENDALRKREREALSLAREFEAENAVLKTELADAAEERKFYDR